MGIEHRHSVSAWIHRVGTASRCGLLLFLAVAPARAVAAPDTNRFTIADSGMSRSFSLALDEVSVASESGRTLHRIAPVASLEDVRRQGRARATRPRDRVEPVLYEVGRPHTDATRRIVTRTALVQAEPGADIAALARAAGAAARRADDTLPDLFLFEAPDTSDGLALASFLAGRPGIVRADPLLAKQQTKKAVMNDPYWPQQWHLANVGIPPAQTGMDIHVTNVWNTYRGSNVVVGVVDDGIENAHADLAANTDTTIDYNWNNGDSANSDPGYAEDMHGTCVAGLIAARGNNAIGVAGVAPEARLVGLRLIAETSDDTMESGAMAYRSDVIHVKNNSWGPADDGATLEGPGTLTSNAFIQAATTGRGGKGTIHVWSAGNGRQYGDNAGFDGYANQIYTIAVSGIGDTGVYTPYSERGSCLVVACPSSGGAAGMVSTDRTGNQGYNTNGSPGELADPNYTAKFGGTSASAPVLSGIVALMLQANPSLGWRDVQDILIRTATKVDYIDCSWVRNGAGLYFNHNYGAGLANAEAAVQRAVTWTNLGPQIYHDVSAFLVRAIPDNNATGIDITLNAGTTNIILEHVQLTVKIVHPYRGDIAIDLVSPSGTESYMAEQRTADSGANFNDWTFMSVRHWGENSQGAWHVRIRDTGAGDSGTLSSLKLRLWGRAGGVQAHVPPVIESLYEGKTFVGSNLQVNVVAKDAIDGDPVTLSMGSIPPCLNPTLTGVWGSGCVTGVFSCRPVETGRFEVSFLASDRDGTTSNGFTLYVAAPTTPPEPAAFESGLPDGWSVVDNAGLGATWVFTDPGGWGNNTPGSGGFAIADSDWYGAVAMDTELRTPAYDFSTMAGVQLAFATDFYYWDTDIADVDVSIHGASGPWTNVWRRCMEDENSLFKLDVSGLAAGQSNVMFRFHYYNAMNAYYWEVDDVSVLGRPRDDLDTDGMADWWETLYFGLPASAAPGGDTDRDGMSNFQEFRAGTDPTNGSSLLVLETARLVPTNSVALQWRSAYGRRYSVERASNLLAGFGTVLSSNLAATALTNIFLDTGATQPAAFYRIRVDP